MYHSTARPKKDSLGQKRINNKSRKPTKLGDTYYLLMSDEDFNNDKYA